MRNLLLTLVAIGLIVFAGFHYSNRNDISLTFSETETELSVLAKFPDEKTSDVQKYLTKELSDSKDLSFENTNIDGKISLNDGTFFHMKLAEGCLKIEMERKKNTSQAYRRMKKLCEGLKKVLTGKIH